MMPRLHEDRAPSPDPHTAERLQAHVVRLAGDIGPRNLRYYTALLEAERYIRDQFAALGYEPVREPFRAGGAEVANIVAERRGSARADRIVLFGAHFDTAGYSPGADDNASGVAALLELARAFASRNQAATVRFVAFVNEEPPHFMTDTMGSLVHARAAAGRGERIAAMFSLESIGYFDDTRGSQRYPPPFSFFFPDRGDFLAMVSNFRSAGLLHTARSSFRSASSLRVIASPAPERIAGVGWSDHWSFWRHGYRAVMFTGTAPYRNPHYHTERDTPDTLDYERLAQVVAGSAGVAHRLSR